MFTGLIDHCGIITQIIDIPSGLQLWIKHQFNDIALGESISVDGVCLTVTETKEHLFCCDISPETVELTTIGTYHTGQMVNLERALLATSRLGGHFVMAHVDQTAHVINIHHKDSFLEMTLIGFDDHHKKLLVKKGSVAVNGVSLTINETTADGFKIMLIPHTLDRTNLSLLREGDEVNVEFDLLARMMVKQLEGIGERPKTA